MAAIFISHSSRDNETAALIREKLREQGHRSVFLDFDPADGIPVGRNWEQELYQRIRECRVVVVLCSEASMASRWCFMEITHARALGKPLFSIRLGDCDVEGVLTDRQMVDIDNPEVWQRLFRGLALAGLDASDPFDWDNSRPPFPGLLAFQEADAAIFFGRDAQIGEGLDLLSRVVRLGDSRFLMVLGASGSGKSSLVRAGLIPRLRRDAGRWWVVGPMRPENDPLRALAVALSGLLTTAGRARGVDTLVAQLRAWTPAPPPEPQGPTPTTQELAALAERMLVIAQDDTQSDVIGHLRRLRKSLQPDAGDPNHERTPLEDLVEELRVATGNPDARLLVVVDQFEELLGQGVSDDAGHFLDLLRASAQSPQGGVVFLGTMRSDFLGALQGEPALRDLPLESLSLGPLSADALAHTIEGPAELAAIDLESGLVQAITSDAERADALPLMAFTLRELYDRHAHDGRLTISEYRDQLGGLMGAVGRAAADAVDMESLDPEQVRELRRAFLGLVRMDERGRFARRIALWSELGAHDLLNRFVTARLLVSGAGPDGARTLEVAHEALFSAWGVLAGWLDGNVALLRLTAELDRSARDWVSHDRADDLVWRGARVGRARELWDAGDLQPDSDAQAFLLASEEAAQAVLRKARRFRMVVFASTVAIAFVIGGFAIRATLLKNEAEEATLIAQQATVAAQAAEQETAEQARISELRASAGRASEEGRQGNHRSAVQLARRVVQENPDAFELRTLFDVAVSGQDGVQVLTDARFEAERATRSGDWLHVRGRKVQSFFNAEGHEVARVPGRGAAISSTGVALVVGDATSRVDLKAPNPVALDRPTLAAAWSPDGAHAAVCVPAEEGVNVELWDAQGASLAVLLQDATCWSTSGRPAIAWAPDGQSVLLAGPKTLHRVALDGTAHDLDVGTVDAGDVQLSWTAGSALALVDGSLFLVDPDSGTAAPRGSRTLTLLERGAEGHLAVETAGGIPRILAPDGMIRWTGPSDQGWLGWSADGTRWAMASTDAVLVWTLGVRSPVEVPADAGLQGPYNAVGGWTDAGAIWVADESGKLSWVAPDHGQVLAVGDGVEALTPWASGAAVRLPDESWALWAPDAPGGVVVDAAPARATGSYSAPDHPDHVLEVGDDEVTWMGERVTGLVWGVAVHDDGQWAAGCDGDGVEIWGADGARVGAVALSVGLTSAPYQVVGCTLAWDGDELVVQWVDRDVGGSAMGLMSMVGGFGGFADHDSVGEVFRSYEQRIPGTVDALIAHADALAPGEPDPGMADWLSE